MCIVGWGMSAFLPVDGFEWVQPEDVSESDIINKPDDADKGLILEVDLEIPQHLHDYFNDYVPAPEHVNITEDMLSPFNKRCLEKLKLNHSVSQKLVPNLHNKEKYVIHYRTLKLYLQLGLKLTKIHRVVRFNQSPWLQKYIAFNTEQRKKAKNTFEKNFFKLMNNSVFGKVGFHLLFQLNLL